jgi:predicted esterase
MVVPQCPPGEQWVDTPWAEGSYTFDEVPISNELEAVLSILDDLAAEFSIDPSRVYVSGISMGGFGTWDILMRAPERFAAAIPLSGGASPSSAELIADIPVWNFHGSEDVVVPVAASREIVLALEALDADITYTEYASGHDQWTEQYQTAGLVEWLFSQARQGAPSVDAGVPGQDGGSAGATPSGGTAGGSFGSSGAGAGAGAGGAPSGSSGAGQAGGAPLGGQPGATSTASEGAGGGGGCALSDPSRSEKSTGWLILGAFGIAIRRLRRARRARGQF